MLHARRHYAVVVAGNTAAAVHLAALLAAAGVGRVRCAVDGTVRLLHAVPGGVGPKDEGEDLQVAAIEAVLRAAPETDVTPLPPDDAPDLVVLAHAGPVEDERRAALHAAGSVLPAPGRGRRPRRRRPAGAARAHQLPALRGSAPPRS